MAGYGHDMLDKYKIFYGKGCSRKNCMDGFEGTFLKPPPPTISFFFLIQPPVEFNYSEIPPPI